MCIGGRKSLGCVCGDPLTPFLYVIFARFTACQWLALCSFFVVLIFH